MELYCAVDIMDGAAVRLTQGDFSKRTDHGDPLELAARYVESGARWLHVVDLDAALNGQPINRSVVLRVVERAGVPVQVGGGARTAEDVAALLDAGVARVVLTTAAVEDPDLVEKTALEYPGQIALGLDHRGGAGGQGAGLSQTVAVRGWKKPGSFTVSELLDRFAGAPIGAVVVTAIERDGMLSGPDVEGLRAVMEWTSLPVIASGGVRSTEDLEALSALRADGHDGHDGQDGPDGSDGPDALRRLDGAIVGRALANGSLDVEEAIAACGLFG